MATAYPINPMHLLGRTLAFVQLFHDDVGPCPIAFSGRVVAVQVPCPGTSVPWSLLIEEPLSRGGFATDYFDLDNLYFEWPDIPNAAPFIAPSNQ